MAPSKIVLGTDRTKIKNISPGEGISVKGIIQSTHKLKSVTVGIIAVDDETGIENPYWSQSYTPNGTKFDMSEIDAQVSFKTLPRGHYRFYVKAVDIYGYEKTLQNDSFWVKTVTVVATEGTIYVEINGEIKGTFAGSINPTTLKNTDGCGTATIAAGTYTITLVEKSYNNHGAFYYRVTTLSGSGTIPLQNKRKPFCNEHKETTATGILVHQAPKNAAGTWSTGCITVRGSYRNGTEEMNSFVNLVGDSATLIVKR